MTLAGSLAAAVLGYDPFAERLTYRKPTLIIGGDHPYRQWYGTNGRNGMAQMYADRGIVPYIAINTDDADGPGSTDMMTWDECCQLQARGIVEFVSHGYWHIDKWNRANTGIRVQYIGSNSSATIQVQTAVPSTALVCTSASPSSDSVTSTFSSDTTLAAVKATIEANGKWRVTLDPILTGNEPSTMLLGMNAARTVTSGGVETVNNTYLCAGGGFELRYLGTNPPVSYEHVWSRRNSSANFTIFGDGVIVYNHTGSTGSLSTLVSNVNAISGSEFVAKLSDNGRTETASKPSYMIGDELETNLKQINYVDFSARPALMEAGLPNWYIVDRQMEASYTVALANGITLKHFAQSGGNFYPWMVNHNRYGMFRGNPLWRSNTPPVMRRDRVRSFMTHRTLTNDEAGATYWPENTLALVRALSGHSLEHKLDPWVAVVLVHALKTDGTSGYNISDVTGGYFDQYEADHVAMLDLVRTQVRAGLLQTATFEQIRSMDRTAKPNNLFFNPNFESASSRMPAAGGSDGGFACPGWSLVRASTMSTMSIADGVMSLVNSSATATELLNQEIDLEPGKTYEFSIYMDVSAYTSGAGLQFSIQAMHGRVRNLITPQTNWKVTGAQIFQTGLVTMRVTIPPLREWQPPKVRAQTAPATFDLSTNKNIKINVLSIGATADIDCSGATPAATTPKEIANKINAAMAADATYSTKGEYHNIASVVDGYLTLTSPNIGTDQASSLAVSAGSSASAVAAIFGNATVDGRAQFAGPATSENFVFRVAIRAALQGSYTLTAPSCTEVAFN